MALNLETALEIAHFSEDASLIRNLVAEIETLRSEQSKNEGAILRLSTDLAYAEARANRLQTQNSELVRAVVNASTEGLINVDLGESA